ncbi:MAG TPA: hypothetical protein VLE43_07250 [Candidatus Saccharimonadia bacterium]|nr:hypothetical protein [Candidatus Saccharimonadia bacterium]
MRGKPKTIPSVSHGRKSISDTGQIPAPYDQNRALKCVQSNEACSTTNSTSESNTPTDENFVNDDIIEENSHVIPPTRKSASVQRGRKGQAAQ